MGEVQAHASFTVPDTVELANSSFRTQPGEKYLVSLALELEKHEESPGKAMYVGFTMSCGSPGAGGVSESSGGTQNILTTEPTTLETALLVSAPSRDEVSCTVTVANPYKGVAASGAELEVSASWQAESVDPRSQEMQPAEPLPKTLSPGQRMVFAPQGDVDGEKPAAGFRVLSFPHLTACTTTNGSLEAGRNWCSKPGIDPAGTAVEVASQIELPPGDKNRCASGLESPPVTEIDAVTHHRKFAARSESRGEGVCSDPSAARATMENKGPSDVVVHGQNTQVLLIVEAEK